MISGENAPGATRDITVRFHVVLHFLHLYINHTSKLFFCAFTRNIPDEANPVLALHFLQYPTSYASFQPGENVSLTDTPHKPCKADPPQRPLLRRHDPDRTW